MRFRLPSWVLCFGCSGLVWTSPPPAIATPHVLAFAEGIEVTNLDPLNPVAEPNAELNWITMAYLVRFGPHGYYPDLATVVPSLHNGGISADGKTLTFHLRKNLRWSDGAPLTSEDIKFSVGLIADPKTISSYRDGFPWVERVDTPDATTAILHLTRIYGGALGTYFSARSAPVLPKHLLAGSAYATSSYVQLPVGSGPFRYSRWLRGERIELERNPYYYGPKPKLEKIIFKMIPNRSSSIVALRTGEVDYLPTQTYGEYKEAASGGHVGVQIARGVIPTELSLNLARPILADRSVRRALLLGTNRASVLQRAFLGKGLLSEGVVSLDDPYVARLPRVGYDPVAARAILEHAGWHRGPDGIRRKNGERLHLDIVAANGAGFVDEILELVRADWNAIGVEVETKRYPLTLMFATADQGGVLFGSRFDVALYGMTTLESSDLGDSVLCRDRPPNGSNFFNLCDRKLDAITDRADASYDPAVFGPLYERVQQIVAADEPFIVLALGDSYSVYSGAVTGLDIEPFAYFPDFRTLDVIR